MLLLRSLFLLIFLFSGLIANAQTDSLKSEIEKYLLTKKAEVGVAAMSLETGESITIGNEKRYPMQSVYKFHLALAVLDQVDKGKFTLDQKIKISKKDLKPKTWSPLRDKYPKGKVELTIAEILNFTISQSDNNGCDILFKLIGGPKILQDYIQDLGFKDVSIQATEAEMHKSDKAQFTNWTTPKTTVKLLEKYYLKNILSKSSFDFLLLAMINTSTGPDRIKGQLPDSTIVAHKTGSSGADRKGITAACNDIGIVTLPNGWHFAIAVFVTNSKEDDDTNARIIADISKMCWEYFKK